MTNADRPPSSAGESTGADADWYWRRPADGGSGSDERPAQPAPVPRQPERYDGPPPTTPPPATWRPPVVVPVSPPRRMPAQDHVRLDAEEQAARTVSHGIGLVAAAVVLILIVAVCARLIG